MWPIIKTGLAGLGMGLLALTLSQIVMIAVGCLLLYLGIKKEYEPLLLVPIGFGALMVNIPLADLMGPEGLLRRFYDFGVITEIFPCLIFVGIGAMTDFSPLLENPKIVLLGAAGQFGIFLVLILALVLGFNLKEAVSIGIIGACDGPTSIYVTSKFAPHMLGAVSVAAYSYMALVPLIQPPIMRVLTTERALMGMLMLGNLLRESGVVKRLVKTSENELVNIVTLLLGISIGATMEAAKFLRWETLMVLGLGLMAICLDTVAGVLFGKLMCLVSGGKINPLIGAAGISAYPMAARVAQTEGRRYDPNNWLLMHAMGANTGGQIGSIMAAAIMLSVLRKLGIG